MYFCSGYRSVQIIISREGGVADRAEGLGGGVYKVVRKGIEMGEEGSVLKWNEV